VVVVAVEKQLPDIHYKTMEEDTKGTHTVVHTGITVRRKGKKEPVARKPGRDEASHSAAEENAAAEAEEATRASLAA
jgi:hypothetical protein